MKKLNSLITLICCTLWFNSQAQFLCPSIGYSSNPNTLNSDSFWVDNFTGNPATTIFEWRFCDGSMESGMSFSHPLVGGGMVLTDCEVCLTVIDSSTSSIICVVCDTFNSTGNLNNGCAAYATYTNVDSLYTFFVSSIGNPVSYEWSVNGNVVATTDSITLVIDSVNNTVNGGASVCVTVLDASGCVSTSCVTLGSNTFPGGGGTVPCQAYFVIYSPDTTNGGVNNPGNGLPGHYWGYNLSSGNYGNDILWDFGDGTTSTDPYPVHVYANPGTYIVCLTVGVSGTNCYDTYCDSSFTAFKTEGEPMVQLNIVSPTGIGSIEEKNAVLLYPNPVAAELNWTADNRIEQVRIFNINGQKIMDSPALSNRMNVAKLTGGIYFLQLTDKTGKVIGAQRFVKE